jgi:hypothetical protein
LEPEEVANTVLELLVSDRTGEVVLHDPGVAPERFEFARMPRR